MSARVRALVPWAALLVAFSAGGAWAYQGSRISALEEGKASVAAMDSVMVELRAIRNTSESTAKRVTQMYCADKPPGCQ